MIIWALILYFVGKSLLGGAEGMASGFRPDK